MNYDNTNRGALFKNEKQEDTHPDYKGQINVNGVECWLSAWIKKSKDGKTTYMSLSATPKDKVFKDAKAAVAHEEPEDEIPF